MQLEALIIERFRNFVQPQTVEIHSDVTCLVGKNESGKTTILKALHRLNPANGDDHEFDITTEYPRWLLARERRKLDVNAICPIRGTFSLSEPELSKLSEEFSVSLPSETFVTAARRYDNELVIDISCSLSNVIAKVCDDLGVDAEDRSVLISTEKFDSAVSVSKSKAAELTADGKPARGKAVAQLGRELMKYKNIVTDIILTEQHEISTEQHEAAEALLPRFFYFSDYDILPGRCDLHALNSKIVADEPLTRRERSVYSLLEYAGERPEDFLDENYDSRKAELQAAAADLTAKVFEYWKQNRDLRVSFDTDMPLIRREPDGQEVRHRILQVELRDERHGGVETNFETRSAGFQWFFSFMAAFSEYQAQESPVIVLLDEPGTSLHGEAQKDFLRFIHEELGTAQQVLYTTHSQHMIDPGRYEEIRAVTDLATRDDPGQGVRVQKLSLAADRETVLPVEAALGYSISQHLFLGVGSHLLVEGGSDFVYLHRLTEHLVSVGRVGLDARFSIIPVGSVDNVPPFVALLGRRLEVSVLVDGRQSSRQLARVKAAASANGVSDSALIVCETVTGVPSNGDIEDLFSVDDYLKLFRWGVEDLQAGALKDTQQPIVKRIEDVRGEYNHALPAHALTSHRDEFFQTVSEETLRRFEELFVLLNGTLDDGQ